MSELLNTAIGPFTAKIWLGILSLALIAAGTVVVISKNRDEKLVDAGREAGASDAVRQGQDITLDQNRKANDAGNKVRDNRDGALYAQCMRNATDATRANCEQFRPVSD